MYECLSESDIEFLEFFHDPVAMIENLIPVNMKAPQAWNEECEVVTLRPYQFAMIAYDYLYEDDSRYSAKRNMDIKKGAGKIYNISARNIGKSFAALIPDALLTIIHYDGIESCVSSFDDFHLTKINEPIVNIVENHKFFKMYHLKGNKKTVSRSPFLTQTITGSYQVGVNENIHGKNPGTNYHSLHFERFLYDEASYISKVGLDKRIDSIHSNGCIERLFGIPALNVGSPLGDILTNPKNKPFICRLPQYVRDDWDENVKEDQSSLYGGESSTSYKLNVCGELIEGAFGKYDMERLKKKCYNPKRKIKFFEIDKEIFKGLDKLSKVNREEEFISRISKKIIIDRLPCTQIIVASDIGTTGSPSEITINFLNTDNKWRYEYQISLFKMIPKEQAKVFNWIYNKLGSCFISLDCSEIGGQTIRQLLIDDYKIPEENLTNYDMKKNFEIGFDRDKKGKVKRTRNGQPIMLIKNTKEWAIKCLEDIFYGGNIEIPHQQKFLKEFTGFFERYTGSRPSWGSTTTEHLHDSFILFALCAWEKINKITQNKKRKKRVLGVI